MVNACPSNCICEELESTCLVRGCEDPISLEYTDFLIIEGLLCENQRVFLNNLTPNTIITLKDDTCGNIRNCRGVVQEVEREESVMPTPGHTRDFIPVPLPMPDVQGNQENQEEEEEQQEMIEQPVTESVTVTITETATEITTETTTTTATETTTETATETATATATIFLTFQPTWFDDDESGDDENDLTARTMAYRT